MLSKYCNSARINLWHYLDKIKAVLVTITQPQAHWNVTLTDVSVQQHSTKFQVVLTVGTASILLDTVNTDRGYDDGRIQIKHNGIWLDLSMNGGNIASIMAVNKWSVPRAYITVPPPIKSGSTYTLSVGTGLTAVYATSTLGNTITIGIDRSVQPTSTTKVSEGVKSINGVLPQDGNIVVRGAGEFEVTTLPGDTKSTPGYDVTDPDDDRIYVD